MGRITALSSSGGASSSGVALPGAYVPTGSLDRWLLSADPIIRICFLGDSIFQGTVSAVDAFPNRLARGIGGFRSDPVITSGAGFYSLLRSGSQIGGASTAYEWRGAGVVAGSPPTIWSAVNALNAFDLAINNTWSRWIQTSQVDKRRVTDAAFDPTTGTGRTLTSATAAFNSEDVGALITSNTALNLPHGTYIASINSSSSVELSERPNVTATGQTVDIHSAIWTWTRPLSALSAQRIVWDATLVSADATLQSTAAAFTPADVGCSIAGPGIPSGTTILSYTSASSVEMSANATGNFTASMLRIGPKNGRLVSDVSASAGTAVVNSSTGAFTNQDVGKLVSGTNIKPNSTIISVQSATQCTISQTVYAATTNGYFYVSASDNGVPIAEVDIFTWGGTTVFGSGFSYSVDGGANWTAVTPSGFGTLTGYKIYRTTIATTNPHEVIVRAQSANTANAAASGMGLIGLTARRLAAQTRGVEVFNLGSDGFAFGQISRRYNLGTTSAATLDGTTNVTGLTGLPTGTNRIAGEGIPDNTTITYVSATQGTLSQAATITGSSTVSIFKTAGDKYAMFDNTLCSAIFDANAFYGWRPHLIVVGFSNDMSKLAPATYLTTDGPAGYVNMLRDLKARVGSYADILVFIDYEQGGDRLNDVQCTADDQTAYRTAIRAWCVAEGVAYFDCYQAFALGADAVGYAAANTAGLMADTFHLSQDGANDVASRLKSLFAVLG